MLRVTVGDRERGTWIREKTRLEDIIVEIKRKKWTWTGHVVRRTDNRWTIRITEWIPRDGSIRRGRTLTPMEG